MDNRLNLVVQFGQKGLDQLQGGLKTLVGLGKTGSQAFRDMKRDARALERELAGVRRELGDAAGNVSELVNRERELERAIGRANEQLRRQAALNEVDSRADAMRSRGEALMSRGRENIVGGGAILAPLVLAAKAGMDYEKKLALLAQKSDLSAKETKVLGSELLRVAENAKLLPDTIIDGADFLASKGLGVAELKGTMPAIAMFGRAWDANVLDASKAAHANFLSLKVPLTQTARALEIMGVAGKEGGFEVKDMAAHFPVLASSLATFGANGVDSVASLSAALQVLEAKTGDGAMAANDLANLLAFTKTKSGQENFKKLGINIVDELKKAEAEGGDAIERLALLIDKATKGDTAKITTLISDQQAGRGALNLVTSLEKYREIRAAAMGAQGVTAAEFVRMSKTSAANWDEVKGSVSILAITLGTHLLPLVNRGVQAITRVTRAVAAWADANPGAARALLMIVGALGAARIGLGVLQFAFGGLLGPMATAYRYFAKVDGISRFATHIKFVKDTMGTAAPVLMRAFSIVRMGAMFLARGLMQAGMMMVANPIVLVITLIVAAVALLAYAVYSNWDKIKAGFNSGVAYVKNLLTGLPSWMKTIGSQMMQGLLSSINPFALGAKLIGMARGGIKAFKDHLKIKSPSRVFMEMGGHIVGGLGLGIDQRASTAMASARRLAAGVAGAAALGTGTPLAAAGGAPARVAATAGGDTYHFTIQQLPGQSSEQLADDIIRTIERKKRARRGSELGDG